MQETHYTSITNTDQLKLCVQISTIYCKNQMKQQQNWVKCRISKCYSKGYISQPLCFKGFIKNFLSKVMVWQWQWKVSFLVVICHESTYGPHLSANKRNKIRFVTATREGWDNRIIIWVLYWLLTRICIQILTRHNKQAYKMKQCVCKQLLRLLIWIMHLLVVLSAMLSVPHITHHRMTGWWVSTEMLLVWADILPWQPMRLLTPHDRIARSVFRHVENQDSVPSGDGYVPAEILGCLWTTWYYNPEDWILQAIRTLSSCLCL